MADADDVRRLALGLPHVEEIDSELVTDAWRMRAPEARAADLDYG